MTLTSGGHAAFERMMRGIPLFDKSPLPLCDLDLSCTRCVHFCPDAMRCRFCRCPLGRGPEIPCGAI